MSDSILTSVKKNLGIAATDTVFDPDLILYINGAFTTLNQLGLGPLEGFRIEGDTETWDQFTEDDLRLESVKTLVTLKVKLLFDPPALSFVITMLQEQIRELEWRLNVYREGTQWVNPMPVPTPPEEY